MISIIIPVAKINKYIQETIPIILRSQKEEFEIIIVTDEKEVISWPKTRLLVSGKKGPAFKRDFAAKNARGEILAFIDDDAYPDRNWLKTAKKDFNNPMVGAVGGPAITPINNSLFQKALGGVSESLIGGGGARNRFISVGRTRKTDDWPTVNLLVRKKVFDEVGGFDTHFWPGEDTKLCLDILSKGYDILYEPQAVVYHHRRKDLSGYLKQVGNYGIHRGYFVKKFPQTSFRFWYFCPSLFLIYFIVLLFCFSLKSIYLPFIYIPFLIYISGLFIDSLVISLRWKNILVGMLAIPLIFMTHLWYGFRFVRGLFTRNLES